MADTIKSTVCGTRRAICPIMLLLNAEHTKVRVGVSRRVIDAVNAPHVPFLLIDSRGENNLATKSAFESVKHSDTAERSYATLVNAPLSSVRLHCLGD